VDRTRDSILAAAKALVSEHGAAGLSVGAVARRAGVARVTVYNRFGSKARLLEALAPPPSMRPEADAEGDPREALLARLDQACSKWASDPALFRQLGRLDSDHDQERDRRLAERLATGDALRPGCSIREAEEVIGALASFDLFDRLHRDGRRTPAAVAAILQRMASGILA